MAGGRKGKRNRKASGQVKSPSQSQTAKKLKFIDPRGTESDCDSIYVDAEDPADLSDAESDIVSGPSGVSTENMAGTQGAVDRTELEQALVNALKDPGVVKTIIAALREDIQKGFEAELEVRDRKIAELEDRIDDLEMYGRRIGIRIHGIAETEHENTDDIVMNLADEIGADIPRIALGRSHRVGRKGDDKPRAIIAKFIGHNHKVKYLRKKQTLRDEEKPQLNHIFVNEDLTAKRAKMAEAARKLKKAGTLTDTWTRDGVVFTKTYNPTTKESTVDKYTRVSQFEQAFKVTISKPNDANALTSHL